MQPGTLFDDMTTQAHLLVAGATGSGKSTVIQGILCSLLQHTPEQVKLILIDPKAVELYTYRNAPHVITYADDPDAALQALQDTVTEIDRRKAVMRAQDLKEYPGGHIYIVIDEMVDLILRAKKPFTTLLQRITSIARAYRVHVIAATQHIPTIPTAIRCNLVAAIGLHTRNASDSRNIIGQRGCESLPWYGYGYYVPAGRDICRVSIPYTTDADVREALGLWTTAQPHLHAV